MAVEKTNTMFLDGEEYARKIVLKDYSRCEWTDINNPPSDLEIAQVIAMHDIYFFEVEIPEGADTQFSYGIQYYLEMMQSAIRAYRARQGNPANSIRVTF